MKRNKCYVCMMLLVFALLCMTGCSNQNNATKNPTTGTTTQPTTSTMPSTTKGTTGTTSTTDETTGTGVIDGLMNDVKKGADDVKKGVEDITDETTAGTANPSR